MPGDLCHIMPKARRPAFIGRDIPSNAPRRREAEASRLADVAIGLPEDRRRWPCEFHGDPTASTRADAVPRVHPKNDGKDGRGPRPHRDGRVRRVSTQSVQDEGFVAPSWGR